MASNIVGYLQGGGGSGAVPGVVQASSLGSSLQGSPSTLQPAAPGYLQGSTPNLQPTANPSALPNTSIIHTPPPKAAPQPPTPVSTALAPANPNATAAVAAPAVIDKSNDIAQQQAALGATNGVLSNGLSSLKTSLSTLLGRYGTEASSNDANYNTQSVTNKGNYLKNIQSAMLNAAQGRQGLFGVLSSLGALSGSGIDLANSAVQSGANSDISGADTNFATNQSGLDSAIGAFRASDTQRKDQANQEEADAEKSLRAQVADKQQTIYGALSNDYADEGNKGQAKTFSDLLSSLFPSVAANTTPSAAPTYAAANYVAPSLASYLSGGTTVNAAPSAGDLGLPGLIASATPAKKLSTS